VREGLTGQGAAGGARRDQPAAAEFIGKRLEENVDKEVKKD
jgi:hypothetical protein